LTVNSEEITDAHMTHCGHNACENCIREALNRRHVCPICNQATTAPQLVKNHAFDSLFRMPYHSFLPSFHE
jgi:hypothetical protein